MPDKTKPITPAEARALAENARDDLSGVTGEPWTCKPHQSGGVLLERGETDDRRTRHPQSQLQIVPTGDGVFIAYAPETVRRLCVAVEFLAAQVEALQGELVGAGRCGAFGTATGRQCIRENDHAGCHILEGEQEARITELEAENARLMAANKDLHDWFDATNAERLRLEEELKYQRTINPAIIDTTRTKEGE